MNKQTKVKLFLSVIIANLVIVGIFCNKLNIEQWYCDQNSDCDLFTELRGSNNNWYTQIRIPVGNQPFSVFIGDANNDGFNDILTANFYGNNVSILIWNSSIKYWNAELTKSVGIYPTSVSVGDVNNDGYNDIIAGNQNSNAVSIFLWNNSKSDWNDEFQLSVGGSPWYVYIADANNDGWEDITTANYVSNDVSIILWNNSISYWNPQIKISLGATNIGPIGVSVRDADNDGYNDIIVANDRSLEIAAILWNSTTSYWNSPKVIYSGVDPYGVVVEDANNDGYNDIIVANRGGSFVPVLFWNSTWNNWTAHQVSTPFGSIFSVAAGDVNNDGYNDIVNAKATPSFDVASIHLWNPSLNYWDEEIHLEAGDRPESVVIGDADNDGHNDIVLSNTDSHDVSIILYEPVKWYIEKCKQILTKDYFNFTFYMYNEYQYPIDFATFQIWWNGTDVSSDLHNLGAGYYEISLEPKTVLPQEDPVLLNMTIKAIGYDDIYFDLLLAVHPFEVINKLNLNIINHAFSIDYFNLTFYLYDDFDQPIDFATFNILWNGTDVSNTIQELGNGLYFLPLEAITILFGEDPILLSMIISVSGFEDLNFETYIGVDPDSLLKGERETPEEFPLILIITISTLSAGVVIGVIGIYWLRKKKRELR
ncbi:MAG: FG-GAP repeat domain-containing protein [Candidatus Hodarchaeota archaeon]